MLFVATQVQSCHGKIIFNYYPCNIHFPNDPVYQQATTASTPDHTYIETNNILWLQAIKTRE